MVGSSSTRAMRRAIASAFYVRRAPARDKERQGENADGRRKGKGNKAKATGRLSDLANMVANVDHRIVVFALLPFFVCGRLRFRLAFLYPAQAPASRRMRSLWPAASPSSRTTPPSG